MWVPEILDRDFDGVYFTLQALRLYQDLANTELLVIDDTVVTPLKI